MKPTLEPNPVLYKILISDEKKHQKSMEGVINYSINNAENFVNYLEKESLVLREYLISQNNLKLHAKN